MKKLVFIPFVLLINTFVKSQDYSVLLIPDSLKEHANAVMRNEMLSLEIESNSKVIVKRKYAITILNEAGDKYGFYYNDYDKLKNLSDIDGNLYDAFGKKLKNVKRKDIADVADEDDYSLATDTRYKFHSFGYSNYPYTVEYEDEVEMNGVLDLPDWYPLDGENESLQQGTFIVSTPKNYNLRYKEINYPGHVVIDNSGTNSVYAWTLKNVKAKYEEPFGPGFITMMTRIMVAPTSFEIEGYSGTSGNWQEYGQFYGQLLKNRDELDDATKAQVHQLTDNLKTTEEKTDTLYKFLQNNTRYISIQLGIGGWQPLDAKFVAQKKYGDCKALSNFMGALLKEAGITSYYAIIKSGRGNHFFYTDFPSHQFDHVIRCVPLQKDTLWLECTDQYIPAGFLGEFTDDRPALLITENGGKLVRTPVYSDKDNRIARTANATLDEKGNLSATVNTIYTDEEYEGVYFASLRSKREDVIESIVHNLGSNNFTINNFNYHTNQNRHPSIQENLDVSASMYANVSGKRMFITPNLFTKATVKFDTAEKRNTNIVFPYSYTRTDTIHITLPQGYNVESMPKDQTMNSKFGYYECHYSIAGNILQYIRISRRESATFPVSDYIEFAKFCNAVYKADHSQVVLVKPVN
mgnify:CR=1 FL=1